MFEWMRRFNLVLVTGPQRSGTGIGARMVAHDTGLTYVDEQRFIATNEKQWRQTVTSESNAVIQCPGMMRFVHYYGQRDDLMIVVMMRAVADIEKSQARIGWHYTDFEKARYPEAAHRPTIAKTKYDYWRDVQRDQCRNYLEVEYESLVFHSLWVPPERRRNFRARQWKEQLRTVR